MRDPDAAPARDAAKPRGKFGLLAATLVSAVSAMAQAESPPPACSPAPAAVAPGAVGTPGSPQRWRPLSDFGMTLAAGGGVTDYTQGSTRNVTQVGGAWDVRMAFETRRLLGFEVSYIGGANTIQSLGSGNSNAMLIRNGIEGALRLNAPLYKKDTLLEPYVAAGVGWNSYRITNVTMATASVSPTGENTVAVPLAVGFLLGYKGFIADVRYTVRPTYGQSTFPGEGSGALTNWDAGGMLGFEF